MADTLTPRERSDRMSRVRSKGNLSTEIRVLRDLRRSGIHGWRRHPSGVAGHPDFYFRSSGLVLFIDGCFWHGCPQCGRRPKSKKMFWEHKIEANKARDIAVTRGLESKGYRVIRVWEHELRRPEWLRRLEAALS